MKLGNIGVCLMVLPWGFVDRVLGRGQLLTLEMFATEWNSAT